MRKYKVLALTDHAGHSEHNSIYSLLRAMLLDARCESVFVASRGSAENDAFFQNLRKETLFGNRVDGSFKFTKAGKYMTNNLEQLDLSEFDVVFMRLPRPISDDFLIWLTKIFAHAVIINDPVGILKTSTKLFLLELEKYCPPIKFCKTIDEIKSFASQFPIVLKPLNEYGGRGLLKIENGSIDDGKVEYDLDKYLESIHDLVERDGFLAMKFLKNVVNGDKRIIVVDGEILASSLRLPPDGSWLCNIAQGGRSAQSIPTEEEKMMIDEITPLLRQNGVLICGVDTLEDDNGRRVLSEINTLSIGGFPQAEAQTGIPVLKKTIKKIFDYVDEHR